MRIPKKRLGTADTARRNRLPFRHRVDRHADRPARPLPGPRRPGHRKLQRHRRNVPAGVDRRVRADDQGPRAAARRVRRTAAWGRSKTRSRRRPPATPMGRQPRLAGTVQPQPPVLDQGGHGPAATERWQQRVDRGRRCPRGAGRPPGGAGRCRASGAAGRHRAAGGAGRLLHLCVHRLQCAAHRRAHRRQLRPHHGHHHAAVGLVGRSRAKRRRPDRAHV